MNIRHINDSFIPFPKCKFPLLSLSSANFPRAIWTDFHLSFSKIWQLVEFLPEPWIHGLWHREIIFKIVHSIGLSERWILIEDWVEFFLLSTLLGVSVARLFKVLLWCDGCLASSLPCVSFFFSTTIIGSSFLVAGTPSAIRPEMGTFLLLFNDVTLLVITDFFVNYLTSPLFC